MLFSGSVRANLDPFNQHDDHAMWTALVRPPVLRLSVSCLGFCKLRMSVCPSPPSLAASPCPFYGDLCCSSLSNFLPLILTKPRQEDVQLKDVVVGLGRGLEGNLSESGTNLSVGQRQLLCLARAILMRNRILVMVCVYARVV